MPDYKETVVTGTQWTRCDNVTISNPYNGTPVIRMSEEVRATMDTTQFSQTAEGLTFDFEPALVVQLRNPATNEIVPGATMTGMDIYVALYSLYIQKAMERDAV